MHGTYTLATSVLLFAFGCEGKPLGSRPGNETAPASTGGSPGTGGVSSSGQGLGGTQASAAGTGGVTSTGGVIATGGSPPVACTTTTPAKVSAANCGDPSTGVGSLVINWYYDYIQKPFQGFAYVLISPTPNPSDTFVCPSDPFGSNGPVVSDSSWCGVGTVPADCTGNAVAVIGFNLNQPQWGPGHGSDQPTSPISNPDPVNSVTVSFSHRVNSDLRVQVAQHSESGSIYYCCDIAGMQSPATVAARQFTKTCWDSANPGAAWDGTGAESIALIIPSQVSKPTPFDACIEKVEFQ